MNYPLQQRKYAAGSAGTDSVNIVQMIAYAIAQLRGNKPTKEGVNLTDTEAVWLLAHLVGDIHQPLHVGARYDDASLREESSIRTSSARRPRSGSARPSRQLLAAT